MFTNTPNLLLTGEVKLLSQRFLPNIELINTSGKQNGKLMIFFMYSCPFVVGRFSVSFVIAKQSMATLESIAIMQMKGDIRSLNKMFTDSKTDFTCKEF